MDDPEVSTRAKLSSLRRVAGYRPLFSAGIVGLSLVSAVLEGIGLTFLFPIIEAAQAGGDLAGETGGVAGFFVAAYGALGLPYTLEFLIVGLAAVMVVRYGATFTTKWLAARLRKDYERELKVRGFDLALGASVAYYDETGSDEVLNAIITQPRYASRIIGRMISLLRTVLLVAVYATIALLIAPVLTLLTAVLLGGLTAVLRYAIEPGDSVGDRVATANEEVQTTAQAGTQGIRDVKLFGMAESLRRDFRSVVGTYADSSVVLARNEVAISSSYQLGVALTLFGLVYVAVRHVGLAVSALGVFLFAMFRLSPRISRLGSLSYSLFGDLPHLVRTHRFFDRLAATQEPTGGDTHVPATVERVDVENVSFAYEEDKQTLDDVSLTVSRGEFVGLVGPSGSGKSTIASLLARLYDPDEGAITANGTDIREFPIRAWRERVALVRQTPYVFDDTLRANIAMDRDLSEARLQEVASLARVSEFLSDLPSGFDTHLGDEGVKLSGGQRQRVALARALVSDPDLLVLDEATSDLDPRLDEVIHRGLRDLDADLAVVTIAHRRSTVTDADRVYTVEDGRVRESGLPADIFDRTDGTQEHVAGGPQG